MTPEQRIQQKAQEALDVNLGSLMRRAIVNEATIAEQNDLLAAKDKEIEALKAKKAKK